MDKCYIYIGFLWFEEIVKNCSWCLFLYVFYWYEFLGFLLLYVLLIECVSEI